MKRIIYWLLGIALIFCLFLVVLSFFSRNQHIIGTVNGRLRPCPETPNCVCSEDEGRSTFVEPFAFKEAPEIAWERLKGVIPQIGGKIQKERDGYLWATFTTKIFRFVDDVEIRMDVKNGIIHVRSASRVGYSDMGMNRKRVENLRARFSKGHPPTAVLPWNISADLNSKKCKLQNHLCRFLAVVLEVCNSFTLNGILIHTSPSAPDIRFPMSPS
ncbi:MAG: DUF1499 domain-containing protein [Candidatus Hodarchaeota archaeon]